MVKKKKKRRLRYKAAYYYISQLFYVWALKMKRKWQKRAHSPPNLVTIVAADAAQLLRFNRYTMYQTEDFWIKSGIAKNVTIHGNNNKTSPKTGSTTQGWRNLWETGLSVNMIKGWHSCSWMKQVVSKMVVSMELCSRMTLVSIDPTASSRDQICLLTYLEYVIYVCSWNGGSGELGSHTHMGQGHPWAPDSKGNSPLRLELLWNSLPF